MGHVRSGRGRQYGTSAAQGQGRVCQAFKLPCTGRCRKVLVARQAEHADRRLRQGAKAPGCFRSSTMEGQEPGSTRSVGGCSRPKSELARLLCGGVLSCHLDSMAAVLRQGGRTWRLAANTLAMMGHTASTSERSRRGWPTNTCNAKHGVSGAVG